MPDPRPDRFPGYDVQAKRNTPSWNEQTRAVIDRRLALPRDGRFLSADEFATVSAIADRIVPQPTDRAAIPIASLIDDKLARDRGDGFRQTGMPRERDAWRRGIAALDQEAVTAFGAPFRELSASARDTLLERMRQGELDDPAWGDIDPKNFFTHRLGHDVVFAYYAHPTSWSEIGWGGPASPRGYVRMGANERDGWEAVEARGEHDRERATRKNHHVG